MTTRTLVPRTHARPARRPADPAAARRAAARSAGGRETGPRTADETVMALALTTVWQLRRPSGRRERLRPRAGLLHGLSGDELVDFWSEI
ncbi:hypothetical protein [Actinomadura atramentaria]|uniref:hypothetical protein n=1 Tax=Actinomadura atramentaria TaxID=1990 RepID=UPI0003A6B798|nr:hypothetical protein [Actinomadura atramentaria]